MTVRGRLRRLVIPVADLDDERLREFCGEHPQAVDIDSVHQRDLATVVGQITNLRIVPRPDGTSWLEATVHDGTGSLVAMWTGRTRLGGVRAGRKIIVSGRASTVGGSRRLLIRNPSYELLS